MNNDFDSMIKYSGILRQDSDATLPFQIIGVHHPLPYVLISAEYTALF